MFKGTFFLRIISGITCLNIAICLINILYTDIFKGKMRNLATMKIFLIGNTTNYPCDEKFVTRNHDFIVERCSSFFQLPGIFLLTVTYKFFWQWRHLMTPHLEELGKLKKLTSCFPQNHLKCRQNDRIAYYLIFSVYQQLVRNLL